MVLLVSRSGTVRAEAADSAFDGINQLDSVKLLALGLLVAAVSVAGRGELPAWLRYLGGGLAALLPSRGRRSSWSPHPSPAFFTSRCQCCSCGSRP